MFNLTFGKTLVCDLALLFVLMFVACSDKVAGGSTEETSVQASLENVSVKGLAMVSSRYESLDSTQLGLALGGLRKGSIVTLYELDSISLDTTGVVYTDTIENGEGRFDIQGMTLKSPYVLVTADMDVGAAMYVDYSGIDYSEKNYRVFRAIADVRDSTPIVVDVISDLAYFRVRFLAKSGIGPAQAMEQAKHEIFDALGIYGLTRDDFDLESLDYFAILSVIEAVDLHSGFTPAGIRAGVIFAEKGSFASIEWLADRVLYKANELRYMLSIPQVIYDRMGEPSARTYQALKLYEKYFAGILSARFGVGRCTSSLEGKSFDVPDSVNAQNNDIKDLYKIVCRSENWHLEFKHVNHTFGTMTDARDGRTYKTVTIDFGGKTQTWMAENLNYNGTALDTTYCYDDKTENCEIYGRQYDWPTAVGLGDSILHNWYANMEECRDSLSKNYVWKDPRPYDSAYVRKCIESLENPDPVAIEKCEYYGGGANIDTSLYNKQIAEECATILGPETRFVDLSNVDLDSIAVTQGVCPDGWRIPTFDDWEAFFEIIEGQWRKYDEGAYFMATPSINESFGFGMYNVAKMEQNDNDEIRISVDNSLYMFIPTNSEKYKRFNSATSPSLGYAMYNFGGLTFEAYYRRMFVRCIKN